MSKPEVASGLRLRLAVAGDEAAIADLLYRAFSPLEEHYTPEAFEVVTASEGEIAQRLDEGPMWLAELDDVAVGTVSVLEVEGDVYVRSMAVLPSAQGRGIGRRLLEAIDEYAAGTPSDRIFLYTTYFSPGAVELYTKHGYKLVRDTPAEEWYGVPGLEMDKRIERKRQNVVGS